MDKPVDKFHLLRLNELKEVLESNNFEVFIAEDVAAAKKIVMEEIVAKSAAKTVSWGGSMTVGGVKVIDAVKGMDTLAVIDTTAADISNEEKLERRRQALLVDLFFTGTNAITEEGQLVNLDMIGNRIGGLTFGPKEVVVLAGRNKVVPDVEDAVGRIRDFVAPVNAMRLDMNTPCVKTGRCVDCSSTARICNTWTITEKSFPKGRVKIVLINEDLGL